MKASKVFELMTTVFMVFSVIFMGGAFGFSLVENTVGVMFMIGFFVTAGVASMIMSYLSKQAAKTEWRTLR